MQKHDRLREAIVAAFPDLARDPHRLAIFIDKGRIAARAAPARGFEYRYTLSAIFEAFGGDLDCLMLTITDWLRIWQPDRLLNHTTGNEAFTFEADILDDRTADVHITLQIDEAVDVSADGVTTHRAEPPLDFGSTADPILDELMIAGRPGGG